MLADFPLSRLYPIFSKLKIENAVVQDHSGKPVGVVHRTCLIDGNLDYSDNSDFAKVNKLQYMRTSQEGVGTGGKGGERRSSLSGAGGATNTSGRFTIGNLKKMSIAKPLADQLDLRLDDASICRGGTGGAANVHNTKARAELLGRGLNT